MLKVLELGYPQQVKIKRGNRCGAEKRVVLKVLLTYRWIG